MVLIPRKKKKTGASRSFDERSDLVLLNLSESERWNKARKEAEEHSTSKATAEAVSVMERKGFTLDDGDKKLLAAAYEMFTTGTISPETKILSANRDGLSPAG